MMKRVLTCLATGLFLVGISGTVQAAGCVNGENLYIEGPSNEHNCKQKPIVQAKVECVDRESFCTEGLRTSPCAKGPKTIVSKAIHPGDFYTEGYSNEELEYMQLVTILNNTVTAAGN